MLREALGEIVGQLAPEIARWPRREPGEMLVDGKFLKYADMHSFFYQAQQIFGERLYQFTCETDAPYIIDCGAHIGLASLFFKDVYPKARIAAFEADPAIADMCAVNLKSFGHDDCTVEAKAVWVNNDGVQFSDTNDDAGHVTAGADSGLAVPTVRLKDLLSQGKVSLLKVDVEGAEFSLLEDCGDALQAVDRMVIEVHVFRKQDGKLGSLLSLLEGIGFQYVLNDLHQATWMENDQTPPFASCPADKYIVTVFAWR